MTFSKRHALPNHGPAPSFTMAMKIKATASVFPIRRVLPYSLGIGNCSERSGMTGAPGRAAKKLA
jgi:hypothetical protein